MDNPNIWTGMDSVLVTGDIAKALNIPQKSGLLILNLSSKEATNKMGRKGGSINAIIGDTELLIGGDIILNFGGVDFGESNFKNLIKNKLKDYNKNDKIPITILKMEKLILFNLLRNKQLRSSKQAYEASKM